jgi:hypothetical protein
MPQFAYSAINAQGNELSGEIHAADLSAARDVLLNGGLLAQHFPAFFVLTLQGVPQKFAQHHNIFGESRLFKAERLTDFDKLDARAGDSLSPAHQGWSNRFL